MATHSSTLVWKIPWTGEPGRLQSMGSLGVGHDRVTSLSLFTFMHWRRKWQPTPVFLPGEFQGRGSLVGCRLRGRIKSGTTEVTQQQQKQQYSSIYDQNYLLSWRRKWQSTPVFLPGEFHGQRSVAGYSPQGRKESDTTKRLTHTDLLPLHTRLQ